MRKSHFDILACQLTYEVNFAYGFMVFARIPKSRFYSSGCQKTLSYEPRLDFRPQPTLKFFKLLLNEIHTVIASEFHRKLNQKRDRSANSQRRERRKSSKSQASCSFNSPTATSINAKAR